MALAVLANNIGVMWVAIEATTVATAFLVGHRRTRAALEATWKYVVICSVGIALAFLGTVLLYFASLHAGASSGNALNIDVLLAHATRLDPAVTHLAAGLLLLGYGAKAGLVPFHTWLADAHSQSPAPVSALMSGVLLSVAFSALLRIKSVVDLALGTGFLRAGLLIVGLLTLLIAASLLVVQTDFKRMLAYSSMENMGLVAVAAAAGTKLAIAALLLHVLAHGIAKTLVFLAAGQLQAAHDSTAIDDVTGVLARSPLIGTAFAVGLAVLLGLPPFAMFASELSISRALSGAHLGWALGARAAARGHRLRRPGPQRQPDAARPTRGGLTGDRRAGLRRRRAGHRRHPERGSGPDRRPARPALQHRGHPARGALMTAEPFDERQRRPEFTGSPGP